MVPRWHPTISSVQCFRHTSARPRLVTGAGALVGTALTAIVALALLGTFRISTLGPVVGKSPQIVVASDPSSYWAR